MGKTFTAHHFGKRHFAKVVTANFQADMARLRPLFDTVLDPERIIEDLSYLTGTTITAEDTLIIFDEIQLCPPALTALKYFAENPPHYAIITTGSLFGVSIHREQHYTFPVGKVDTIHMRPLDFEEYLWAQNMELQAEGIRRAVARRDSFAGHDDMVRQVRQYMMTGGLPRVVSTFIATRDWSETRRVQRDLALLYTADMALYADAADSVRTRAIWESAPRQLARDTSRKFKLADMKSGARFHQYDTSFAWLEAAGLVHRHYQAEEPSAPLRARDDGTFFKVYIFDVGILAAQLDISAGMFCSDQDYMHIVGSFRGGIAENYAKQALACAGIDSMYWSSGNAAEIDFLMVDDMMIVIPMEVKSADNIQSRSLDSYRQRYHPLRAIRLSAKNVGQEDDLLSLPLYAAFCLPDVLRPR